MACYTYDRPATMAVLCPRIPWCMISALDSPINQRDRQREKFGLAKNCAPAFAKDSGSHMAWSLSLEYGIRGKEVN